MELGRRQDGEMMHLDAFRHKKEYFESLARANNPWYFKGSPCGGDELTHREIEAPGVVGMPEKITFGACYLLHLDRSSIVGIMN